MSGTLLSSRRCDGSWKNHSFQRPLYVWFYYFHTPVIERIEYLQELDKEINNS
jgi:hypothetical protein